MARRHFSLSRFQDTLDYSDTPVCSDDSDNPKCSDTVYGLSKYQLHNWLMPFTNYKLERFLYYTTVCESNKIFPSTYMEAVALTMKATQAKQHQHSSLRLSCYLLMWAVAYLVKWNWCCSACVRHHNEIVALSVSLPTV